MRSEERCRYLNNIVEQDHRAIKRRCAAMTGFKSFHNASITLAGIELGIGFESDSSHSDRAVSDVPGRSNSFGVERSRECVSGVSLQMHLFWSPPTHQNQISSYSSLRPSFTGQL